MKTPRHLLAWILCLTMSPLTFASSVEIDVHLPEFTGSMIYRPYVAVWIEDAQGNNVATVSVWRKEPDWLKDMRRWWRKAGRYDQGELDAVTSATRRPGIHTVVWNATDQQGNPVPPGTYAVNIEAAREHGSRSLVRQEIQLGTEQTFTTEAAEELGSMTIRVIR